MKRRKIESVWKYVLLIVGGILILVPLLVTVLVPSRQPRIS